MKLVFANRKRLAGWFLVALLAIGLSRYPLNPEYLSLDNVNLAFALSEFDPWNHQPHPPGYPLFVVEARIVDRFFDDPRDTLNATAVLASAVSLMLAAAIAGRMFSPLAGIFAALLLLFNPVFWFSSLMSPLRIHLALFSLLVAYCCWRAWMGSTTYATRAAVLLGLGCGFRPDLAFYLGPLWLISTWRAGQTAKEKGRSVFTGGAIIVAFIVLWTAVLAWSVGGLARFNELISSYLQGQVRETSVLFDESAAGLFHFTRLITWNGICILSWIIALPWAMARWRRDRAVSRPDLLFFLAWIAPGLIAQGILHAAAPGHTLFSVAALCVLGGGILFAANPGAGSAFPTMARWALPILIAAINLAVFMKSSDIGLWIATRDLGHYSPVAKAVGDGFFQTSYGHIEVEDDEVGESLQEVKRRLSDDCDVIISAHGSYRFFRLLNWRIASYYFPDNRMWIIGDELVPPRASLIRGKERIQTRDAPTSINIPPDGDLIWLLDPKSDLRQQLDPYLTATPVEAVFTTPMETIKQPFTVGPFEFVPTPEPCTALRMY